MTKPAIEKPVSRKANPQSNSVAWAILGAAGLGYLGIAFFAPHLLPDLSAGRTHVTETTVMKVSADVESLKSELSKLEADMSGVKADVAAQASQTQTLNTQVSALEEKARTAEAPQNTASAEVDHAQMPAGLPGTAFTATTNDSPPPPKIINAPRVGAPIETGSVNSGSNGAPISFGPAVVKPAASKPVGIQIATDPSVDGLRVTWGALSQIHPEELGNLKARYADIGTASNPNFGLIAGPVKSKVEAKKICKALAAQNISCKVSDYKGEEL